jgi:hypothetical protein
MTSVEFRQFILRYGKCRANDGSKADATAELSEADRTQIACNGIEYLLDATNRSPLAVVLANILTLKGEDMIAKVTSSRSVTDVIIDEYLYAIVCAHEAKSKKQTKNPEARFNQTFITEALTNSDKQVQLLGKDLLQALSTKGELK